VRRYDGVIHLVTAANGAPSFYKQGHTTDDVGNPVHKDPPAAVHSSRNLCCSSSSNILQVFRHESVEQAVALDEQMQRCWKLHPNQVIVNNDPTADPKASFHEKQVRATAAVLKIATKTTFKKRADRVPATALASNH